MAFYKNDTQNLLSTNGEFWPIKKLEEYLLKKSEDGILKLMSQEYMITIRCYICNIFGVIDSYEDSGFDGKHIREVVITYGDKGIPELKIHFRDYKIRLFSGISLIKIGVALSL